MSLTNAAEAIWMDHFFGGVAYTPPATWYVGLSTTTINEDGSGITEPVGASYVRAAISNNLTNWPAYTTQKANGISVVFPRALEGWGNVVYFFIADQVVGGTPMVYGVLTGGPIPILVGDQPTFALGGLTLLLD